MTQKHINCWIVTEGMAGTENQCLGVAEALGITPKVLRINLREPWKSFSPFLGFEHAKTFTPPLSPPWPDLLLCSGRKSIAASRYIKRQSGGRIFTVQIQDPRVAVKNFDLVAVPAHDPARGSNVVVTQAAPNRITSALLQEGRAVFPEFASLPSPRVAVLIGGDSRAHKLTPFAAETLGAFLKNLNGAGLMVTASRRTSPECRDIIARSLPENARLWDGTGDNPYLGYLAWADYILVTADSVSMLSDAGTTGKPVYVFPLPGGAARLDALHDNLEKAGITRRFEGRLDPPWSYTPLNDSQKIADAIRNRLKIPG